MLLQDFYFQKKKVTFVFLLWCISKTIFESENNDMEDSGLQHFNVNSTQRSVVEKFTS